MADANPLCPRCMKNHGRETEMYDDPDDPSILLCPECMTVPEPATFIVTFPVGGPLRRCYSKITTVNEQTARLAVLGIYGNRGWSGIYPATEDEEWRHRNLYNLNEVPLGHLARIAEQYRA